MTEECPCDFCKAEKLDIAFRLTAEAIREQARAAKIVYNNQVQGLARMDIFERSEFALTHPKWAICIQCDHLERKAAMGGVTGSYLCMACDGSMHA